MVDDGGPSTVAAATVVSDEVVGGGGEAGAEATTEVDALEAQFAELRLRYPLKPLYCPVVDLPAEVCDALPKAQFEKCRTWLAAHCPQLFPDEFPDECAARLAAGPDVVDADGDDNDDNNVLNMASEEEQKVKVAQPIEQKTSGGKKKKAAAEVVLTIGQRKGKKQVTIVYGLDLFGIKLKDAAKVAKKKFATGSSVTTSADARDVIEIQGSRQEDFANLVHSAFGVPKEAIFIVTTGKKKVPAFPK